MPRRNARHLRLTVTMVAMLLLMVGPGCVSWTPIFLGLSRLWHP